MCECFHAAAGEAVSQSQVEEWMVGSFIQSHWPCRTLCPISMFSRIFATDSPAVPSTQAGLYFEKISTARDIAARRRCSVIMLRM